MAAVTVSRFTSANTVRTPSPTSACAIARPIPLPAPVTSAASRVESKGVFNRLILVSPSKQATQFYRLQTGLAKRIQRRRDSGRRTLRCCAPARRVGGRTLPLYQFGAHLHRQVASTLPETVLSLPSVTGGLTTMRTRVRKVAHVLERLGLAMAGAASGLFVAALVGTSHAALTNQAFLLVMMIGGAVGFYLGIDTPPAPFSASNGLPADGAWVGKIDTPELLSAVGTFLAAFSAFACVGVIVLRHDPHQVWIWMIMAGWVVGVAMQIIAGAIARLRH